MEQSDPWATWHTPTAAGPPTGPPVVRGFAPPLPPWPGSAPSTPQPPPTPPRRHRWPIVIAGLAGVVAMVATAVAITAARGGGSAADTCPRAEGRPSKLRTCLGDSLAYIETSISTGTGILIDDGYVVTNANVIDPFERVDLRFEGFDGRTFRDVPVVGVDAFSDLAVLGPIDPGDRRALTFAPLGDLKAYDDTDVYHVGYPAAFGLEPSLTIGDSSVERIREDDAFDNVYLQSDAEIGDGLVGGVLVDDNGRLLGLPTWAASDSYKLALTADDVAESVEQILDGDGDPRGVIPCPDEVVNRPLAVRLTEESPYGSLIIPAEPDWRSVKLEAITSADVAILLMTLRGDVIGANKLGQELTAAWAEEYDDPTYADVPLIYEGAEDGHYEFDAPQYEDLYVTVVRGHRDTVLKLSVNIPFCATSYLAQGQPVEVGTPVRGTLDGLTFRAEHVVQLRDGDEIEVTVHGGTADLQFVLIAPGEVRSYQDAPDGDDGGGGVFNLDPEHTFRIDETGEWRILVRSWDGFVTGYELDVHDAD